jgi:hypothetical protein
MKVDFQQKKFWICKRFRISHHNILQIISYYRVPKWSDEMKEIKENLDTSSKESQKKKTKKDPLIKFLEDRAKELSLEEEEFRRRILNPTIKD